jgi:hypothetical protein
MSGAHLDMLDELCSDYGECAAVVVRRLVVDGARALERRRGPTWGKGGGK